MTSVYTTLRVQNGEPLWLDAHLMRLQEHALAFNLSYPGDNLLRRELYAFCNQNQLVRISLSASYYSLTPRPLAPPSALDYQGASLLICNDLHVDTKFARYKTEDNMAVMAARTRVLQTEVFETLFVDSEGFLVDGSRSSPLLFDGNILFSLEGGLQGITREQVLRDAQMLGIAVGRTKRKYDSLKGTLLVAGSGMGLVPGNTVHEPRLKALIDRHRVH